VDGRAFAAPKRLRPRRRDKPGNHESNLDSTTTPEGPQIKKIPHPIGRSSTFDAFREAAFSCLLRRLKKNNSGDREWRRLYCAD
jgi:hypothetical protein